MVSAYVDHVVTVISFRDAGPGREKSESVFREGKAQEIVQETATRRCEILVYGIGVYTSSRVRRAYTCQGTSVTDV